MLIKYGNEEIKDNRNKDFQQLSQTTNEIQVFLRTFTGRLSQSQIQIVVKVQKVWPIG